MAQRSRVFKPGVLASFADRLKTCLSARMACPKVQPHSQNGSNVARGSAQVFVALGKSLIDGAGAVQHARNGIYAVGKDCIHIGA